MVKKNYCITFFLILVAHFHFGERSFSAMLRDVVLAQPFAGYLSEKKHMWILYTNLNSVKKFAISQIPTLLSSSASNLRLIVGSWSLVLACELALFDLISSKDCIMWLIFSWRPLLIRKLACSKNNMVRTRSKYFQLCNLHSFHTSHMGFGMSFLLQWLVLKQMLEHAQQTNFHVEDESIKLDSINKYVLWFLEAGNTFLTICKPDLVTIFRYWASISYGTSNPRIHEVSNRQEIFLMILPWLQITLTRPVLMTVTTL